MTNKMNKSGRSSVVRIVAIYAVFSGLWIYLSDGVLGFLSRDVTIMTRLSQVKGIVFIVLTSLLLYRLIIRHTQVTREAESRINDLNLELEKRNADLDAERAYWRAAIEGIADEVWISDEHGRISLVNLPAVTEMGLEDFKDKMVEEILEDVEIQNQDGKPRPPGDAPLLRSLRGEIVRGEEIMLHRLMGKRRYRQFSSAPMRDAAGAITGAVAIVRDITDHKQAEKTLETLLSRMKLLFDASVKITSQTNLNDLLTAVAAAARELVGARYCAAGHGYVNGKFITGGSSCSEGAMFCPPGQVFNVERGGVYMDLLEKSETICLSDVEMREHPKWWGLPDDHVPMRGLLGSRLVDFKGRPNGMIMVSDKEDGSEFTVEDEAALRQLAIIASLALQHIESEDSLHLAKEAAEAANLAKSQFLANMSHELRTPMTGVLGMLDLALFGNLEAEQREFIETARTSARSLVRILNDILDLTRIEKGKLSIVEKTFSIRKCLENTIDILLPVAKSKGIELDLKVADKVPETLVGDPNRLNQVLTNLAGNAVKFTEKGKVQLGVTASDRAPGCKRMVTFTVTDSGIGIPDDKKDLIFRVFSQVDESHTRSYGGIGLGLAISNEVVKLMGGTIAFTSEEGKGSTFSFTIPFSEAESECEADSVSGKTTREGEVHRPAEMTKPRLLVAEDDQTIVQVLGSMLRMAEYEVDFAENGQKVVEMWEKGIHDLILMDVQMPAMNGFEATVAIREKERSRGGHIPIIAMTAHASKEDEKRCLDTGMDAYISKPIDFMVCLQLIKDNLRT